MGKFLSAEKEPLDAESAQNSIELCKPMRHADVVGVLGLAHEVDPLSEERSPKPIDRSAIGRNDAKRGSPVADQAKTYILIGWCRSRSAKNRSNQIVVQEWGSKRHLCLLERQKTVVMPRA